MFEREYIFMFYIVRDITTLAIIDADSESRNVNILTLSDT